MIIIRFPNRKTIYYKLWNCEECFYKNSNAKYHRENFIIRDVKESQWQGECSNVPCIFFLTYYFLYLGRKKLYWFWGSEFFSLIISTYVIYVAMKKKLNDL